MAILPASGPVVLAAGVAAVAAGLVAGSASDPRGSPGPAPDLEEMRVLGVQPLEDGESNMLVLAARDGSAVLPLVVGRAEALAIRIPLLEATPPRPLTHDLLERSIEALGAAVSRVEIDRLENGTFLATVRLVQGGRALALDARPSDSVALALRARAPIYAARRVLRAAGVDRREMEELRRRGGEPVPDLPHQRRPGAAGRSL